MPVKSRFKIFPVILTTFCFCFGPFNPDDPAPEDPSTDSDTRPSITKGIVAHWNFNENENVLIKDISDYKNNGSASNCIWDSTGVDDSGALVFNGTNSFVAVGHDSSLDFDKADFTISAWIKPDTSLKHSNNGRYDIISKGESGKGFTISLYRNKVCGFVGSMTAITDADTNTMIFDTLWHNIMLIRNKSTITMYFDNKQVHSYNYSATVSTSSDLYLGKNISRSTLYSGLLDQLKIMNYAWSSSERISEINRFKTVQN